MIVYAIPGLGADERMFEKLKLNIQVKVINYVSENKGESLENYAKRMAASIDTSQEFALVGVSFGGILVVEMNKFLNPKINFLITTVKSYKELPWIIHLSGFIKLNKILPIAVIKSTKRINNWFFGTESKEDEKILDYFIKNASRSFLNWGIDKIVNWRNVEFPKNIIRIHGDNDRILPIQENFGNFNTIKGGHLIIVNRANEISELINRELS